MDIFYSAFLATPDLYSADAPQISLALPWLHNLVQSKLFHSVWIDRDKLDKLVDSHKPELADDYPPTEVLSSSPQSALLLAVKVWYNIKLSLDDETLPLAVFASLSPFLIDEGELAFHDLSQSAFAAYKHVSKAWTADRSLPR